MPETLAIILEERWGLFRTRLASARQRSTASAVHDLRVATRRLIAAIDLVAPLAPTGTPGGTRRRLKKLLDALTDLRDAQVQGMALRPMILEYPVLTRLAGDLREQRQKLLRSARQALVHVRIKREHAALVRLTEDILQSYDLPSLAAAGDVRVVAQAAQAYAIAATAVHKIRPHDTATIHRARVAFKKYRYAVEILGAFLPWADAELSKRMNNYQTRMGEIQDIEVLLGSIERFAQKGTRGQTRRVHSPEYTTIALVLQNQRQNLILAFLAVAGEISTFWKSKPWN
jgi:CHAD domain-containing protein